MASIMKRRWVWRGQPKEAWQVEYRDATGKRRHKQFKIKAAAEIFRDRAAHREQIAKAERAELTVPDPTSPTGYRKVV